MAFAAITVWLACSGPEPEHELVLEGPSHLRVTELGPVSGAPRVVSEDGTPPDRVMWTLSRPGVAHFEGGRVVAEGPGEVVIVAEWEGRRVEWTLSVELGRPVSFVDPPSWLRVGQVVPLVLHMDVGGQRTEVQAALVSSAPEVLAIDGHAVKAVAPGTAFVTAATSGGSAMLEVHVFP